MKVRGSTGAVER